MRKDSLMSAKKFFISERFFSSEELEQFEKTHGYKVTEIGYMCANEIDFSDSEEKEFLMKEGFPKILARFFA